MKLPNSLIRHCLGPLPNHSFELMTTQCRTQNLPLVTESDYSLFWHPPAPVTL